MNTKKKAIVDETLLTLIREYGNASYLLGVILQDTHRTDAARRMARFAVADASQAIRDYLADKAK